MNAKIDTNIKAILATQEIMNKMKKENETKRPSEQKRNTCETTGYKPTGMHGHEVTEADAEKIRPDPGIMQSVAEHQKVPKEDVVKPVKGRKRRHRGKEQAAGRRGEPKELTRGDCGSLRKLAAACRKVSRRATVHGARGKSSENLGPTEIVDGGRK
jgi:hypothetical protein